MDLYELNAGDIMCQEVETIKQNESITRAAIKMRECGVSSLVVERCSDNDAWGIITRKDIVDAFMEENDVQSPLLVEDIMSKPALTVSRPLAIVHCLQMMKMVGVRRLPVVSGDELVGILSNTDMFKKIADHLD